MPQEDVTCCRCGQDLGHHGYLWKAVLWWCDNCYNHVCRDVVVTGILPHKGCTLPQKYSSVHIDELHGTIPLWMAPKNMEDFHEPEENRKWVFLQPGRVDLAMQQRRTQVRGENPGTA